jgi:hypothetical protein
MNLNKYVHSDDNMPSELTDDHGRQLSEDTLFDAERAVQTANLKPSQESSNSPLLPSAESSVMRNHQELTQVDRALQGKKSEDI